MERVRVREVKKSNGETSWRWIKFGSILSCNVVTCPHARSWAPMHVPGLPCSTYLGSHVWVLLTTLNCVQGIVLIVIDSVV